MFDSAAAGVLAEGSLVVKSCVGVHDNNSEDIPNIMDLQGLRVVGRLCAQRRYGGQCQKDRWKDSTRHHDVPQGGAFAKSAAISRFSRPDHFGI